MTEKGGLLGKLLLPGYADAGASTTFKSPRRPDGNGGRPRIASGQDDNNDDDDGNDDGKDHESEAVTEIRDNRASVKHQFTANNLAKTLKKTAAASAQVSTDQRSNADAHGDGLGGSSVAGFFPSTKPLSTLSPRPESPPALMRRQLPAQSSAVVSVAGTSMVPETGATEMEARLRAAQHRGKENQQRFQFWEGDIPEEPQQQGDQQAGQARPTLTAENIQKARSQAIDNDNDASNSETSSSSSRHRPNRAISLIVDDDATSEVVSEAFSTASEMGTVIEVGNHAARMAEIDAMAALIEASPNVDHLTPRLDSFPRAPSQTPQRRAAQDTASVLALPVLEGNTFDEPVLFPQSKTKQTVPHDEGKGPAASSQMASALLTNAIRRIGTGLQKTKTSLSAPPTPKTPGTPRVEDFIRSTLTPRGGRLGENYYGSRIDENDETSPSLSLKSPGSSAQNKRSRGDQDQPTAILAPRFSKTTPTKDASGSIHRSLSFDYTKSTSHMSIPTETNSLAWPAATSTSTNKHNQALQLQHPPLKLNPISPFRLAQKCFSFDSTLDEGPPESTTSSQVLRLEASYPPRRTEYHSPKPAPNNYGIRDVASWDVGGASAFRAQPHRSFHIGGLKQTDSQQEHNDQRARFHSVDSPTKLMGRVPNNTMELQTPHRVMDVEREDALDILACLVQRGVTAWHDDDTTTTTTTTTAAARDKVGNGRESSDMSTDAESLVATLMEELRESSTKDDKDGNGSTTSRAKQIEALDELIKSHSYALEMRRAALSAAGWLKSIGPGSSASFSDDPKKSPLPAESSSSRVGQAAGEDAASAKQPPNTNKRSASPDYKMELLTLKARFRSMEQELRDKNEMASKLNEELSKCRAEIGRLQIATRPEVSITHNRSILDEEAEDSTTTSNGPSVSTADPSTEKQRRPSPIPRQDSDLEEGNKMFEESFQGNNSLFQDLSTFEAKNRSQEAENLDILVLKSALEQANNTIRTLHEQLQKDEEGEDGKTEPPVVEVPDTNLSASTDNNSKPESSTSLSDEHRTINVRMLDGENFVTEWDEFRPALPPPPDHGLRSPIVDTVLEQWTTDRALHESLLTWMERVMTSDNLESSVPPLTISSLDHQVRDGFTMHVLPLLLRRADIHVRVQMRAHRRTSYDLAVTVSQKGMSGEDQGENGPSLLDQHVEEEWNEKGSAASTTGSVAHSAVTAPIGNGSSRFNVNFRNHDEDAEYSHFGLPHPASTDTEDPQHPTIMGALGGALAGLLSRGKNAGLQSPHRYPHNEFENLPASVRASMDLTSSPIPRGNQVAELDYQPYHRVVSAPPGRIGVTFVEFRGHAMVSDVAPDSPLSSWVFPSDILIAVDEVPVSGMRVRDIIKVLTNRKDRQRALRVISSHAMNEFTLNQSILSDEPP